MINDRTDFKYITPPTGVIVDGDFLATQSQSSQQSKALMWQDIGYLIEATKERDFLCTCRPNYNPYPFFYNTSIRKQNPINVSKWLYNKYANKGAYPEYAYLGSYLENYDPVWGTPMFLDEEESVEDVIGSGTFVDVTSRTHYNPRAGIDTMEYYRTNYLAGNEIYQSICSELSGASRFAELSDAHDLDTQPIIDMQKNMNTLKKVFYGCYACIAGVISPSTAAVRTQPFLWDLARSGGTLYKRNDAVQGNPYEIYTQYANCAFENMVVTWTPFSYIQTEPNPRSGWDQYGICDGDSSLVFQYDNQSKVRSFKLWSLFRVWYGENFGQTYKDDRWVLTKWSLTKSGTLRLADGKTYDTWNTSGLRDQRPWAEDLFRFIGHPLDPTHYEQYGDIAGIMVNFAEVTYEPNTMMNLPSENE